MRILAAVLFALATTLASWAEAQDFPIRVGRIAHIEGQASLFQDPEAGWERAYINSPITSENSVWTDDGSRAELRVSGMAIRLDHLTQLDVARLDEDELDAFVARGSVAVRVRHHENTERLVFSTPNARVRLREDGRYRIDFDPERFESRITVFAGEARVGAEDGRIRVAAGHSVVVFGADPPEFVEERVITGAFDRWTLARDDRWREGRAPTYVSTYMTGYEDLDAYGQWGTEPDYGAIWYPRQVAADWAPYRYGRWDYVRPWGWTWVDDAPWGYAPFHYGRWVYVRDRWGWLPGERIARPVWAPALVAWVGGSNWSVGVSSGGPSLGWYPLSPWDRYQPWFQASPTYIQRVNVVVRSEPTRPDRRQWREWTRERGMTVVDRRAVIEQQPVQRSIQRVSTDVIRRVQAAPQPQAVLPTRNDVIQRRRERPQQAVAAPRVIAQAPAPSGTRAPAQSQPSAIVRPNFGRNAVVATPRQSNEQQRQAQRQQAQQQRQAGDPQRNPLERAQGGQQQAQERQSREQQQAQRQAQERAQREEQQGKERQAREQQQAQRQAQERAQREQQQAKERQAREQQQAQQQAKERQAREQQQAQQQAKERQAREQQQAKERAQREQQQAQERQAREQQQAQRQAQERAQREQQQAKERQAREQQQAQQQAKERAQREQQQAQERQAREQQQAQRQAQERAQREQQQAQQRQAREQQQAQQQAKERAQREQQQAQERQAQQAQQAQRQAQERAQREQQQAQQRQAQQAQQAQERAQREQQQAQQAQQAQAQQAQRQSQGKGRDKDDDDEKGKGRNR